MSTSETTQKIKPLKVTGFNNKKKIKAQADATQRFIDKSAELEDVQECGPQLQLIKLTDLKRNPINSRRFKFTEIEMKSVITRQFGEEYNPLDLPSEFDEFIYAKDLLPTRKSEHAETIKFFMGIIDLAKKVVTQNEVASKIPPIDTMLMASGELLIQSGHRRFYGYTIARKNKILSNPIVKEQDYTKASIITSNLNENLGQEQLSFSDKIWSLCNALESTALQLNKSVKDIKRSEFIRINNIDLRHVKNIYPQMTTNHVSINFAKVGVFINEGSFRNFLKLNLEAQSLFLEEQGFDDLTAMLYEGVLENPQDIQDAPVKTRIRKTKSYAFSKIKDPDLGKAIISVMLKHKSLAGKRDEVMGEYKSIPTSISEQAELVERLNEFL